MSKPLILLERDAGLEIERRMTPFGLVGKLSSFGQVADPADLRIAAVGTASSSTSHADLCAVTALNSGNLSTNGKRISSLAGEVNAATSIPARKLGRPPGSKNGRNSSMLR